MKSKRHSSALRENEDEKKGGKECRSSQLGFVGSVLHDEVYVAKDGSEACLSLNPPKAFCAQNGAVRETRLELAFSRYETYEDKTREVYRPKWLLAFAAAAREYVRML